MAPYHPGAFFSDPADWKAWRSEEKGNNRSRRVCDGRVGVRLRPWAATRERL